VFLHFLFATALQALCTMVIDDNSQFDKVDRGYSDTVVLAFVLNGEHRRLVYVPRLCWDTGQ
jgi:hypothetical protein